MKVFAQEKLLGKAAPEMLLRYSMTLPVSAAVVGMLNPFDAAGLLRLASAGLTGFALEAAPRTTRAQSMDVLSSQANIAGYKAVMIAADRYQRFFPMLMTAAGTVKAARVVILGVGVAGLQIARLHGARVVALASSEAKLAAAVTEARARAAAPPWAMQPWQPPLSLHLAAQEER